jgi:hypothetical protein
MTENVKYIFEEKLQGSYYPAELTAVLSRMKHATAGIYGFPFCPAI